jgi:plasmid stability protein
VSDILVDEVDEATIETLEELARAKGRSLEEEVKAILKEAAEHYRRRRKAIQEIEALRAEFAGRAMTDSVYLLHGGREEWEAKWEEQ